MHPLLTFASGLVAGIVGVRLLNKATPPAAARLDGIGDKARQGLAQAQTGLRDAAVSGLTVIEKSSASLRTRLEAAATPAAPAKTTGKVAKPRRPRKAKAAAVTAGTTENGGSS